MVWPFSKKTPPTTEVKDSVLAPTIAMSHVGNAVWRPRDYATFIQEGYVENPIVSLCMEMVAKAVSEIPLITKDAAGKDVDNPPFADLMAKTSPGQTMADVLRDSVIYYLASGNVYLEGTVVRNKFTEIYTHRPDRCEVVPGKSGQVVEYVYTVNGIRKIIKRDITSGQSAMQHVKRFNPTNDFYGLSALESIARDVDIHNEARSHMMALYQNGASPSGALVMKPIKSDGSDVMPPADFVKDVSTELLAKHQGSKNAGRAMVLGGNVDWKQFGITPTDMGHLGNMDQAAKNICAGLGVPHVLVVSADATFNNMREANLAFYENTVIPIAQIFVDALNGWMVPRFAEGLELVIEKDGIEALSLRREMKQKRTLELFDKGMIDRDEAREELQYEPQPNRQQISVDNATLRTLVDAVDKETLPRSVLFAYCRAQGLEVGADLEAINEILEDQDDGQEGDEIEEDEPLGLRVVGDEG